MNTRSLNRSIRWTAASVAALCLTSFGAHAAEPATHDALQQVIQLGDLNLDRPGDVARLYRRVSRAAERVCGPAEPRQLKETDAWRACFNDAIAQAATNIGSTAFATYATTLNGHSARIVLANRAE